MFSKWVLTNVNEILLDLTAYGSKSDVDVEVNLRIAHLTLSPVVRIMSKRFFKMNLLSKCLENNGLASDKKATLKVLQGEAK